MHSRLELNDLLSSLFEEPHVYFQPPANIQMEYPAIVYAREGIPSVHANNAIYKQSHSYKVTVIDKSPTSELVDKVALLPRCRFATHFTSNGLNHDVFYIYY